MSRLNEAPNTWGAWQNPSRSTDQLELEGYLAEVPAKGVVVDVGAGIANELGAAIHLTRPDLVIVSVDPGFGLKQHQRDRAEAREILCVEKVGRKQRSKLEASDAWYADSRPGFAEDLPVDSGSADFVVSYAAVPEFVEDEEAAFKECVRVLKNGGIALHGPVPDWSEHTLQTFEAWDTVLRQALEAGMISEYRSTEKEVEVNSLPHSVDANFTFIRK